MHDTDFDPGVLDSLSNLLFMKRKSKEPNSQERAFASQEETVHAILSVLKIRKSFLRSKNIVDHRYVLTEDERGELTKRQREAYESTPEQLALQARDPTKVGATYVCAARSSSGRFWPSPGLSIWTCWSQ